MKNIIQKLGNVRTDFNDKVRESGNEFTYKHLHMPKSYINKVGGLGSLLTANLNFRRAGAVIGGISPYVGSYLLANCAEGGNSFNTPISTLMLSGIATITMMPLIFGKLVC